VRGGTTVAQIVAPPKPNFGFAAAAYVAPAIVVAWEKQKGTNELIVTGHDPRSLAVLWESAPIAGNHLSRVLHSDGAAVLVPSNPGPDHLYFDKAKNPCAIQQLDPVTGQLVTSYPVELAGCVEVHGHFLCATADHNRALHVVYDLRTRERLL
jgi:hypothetical protein